MANHGFHSQASVLSSGGLPFQPDPLHLLRKSRTPSKQVSRCTKGPGGNRRAGLALVVFIVPPSGVIQTWVGKSQITELDMFKWGNSSD